VPIRPEELRRVLLDAGKHLSPTRFGYVVSRVATVGIDWGGSSKGQIIKGVAEALDTKAVYGRYRARDFTLEQLVTELRKQEAAPKRRR
jgi:hypothetical protein